MEFSPAYYFIPLVSKYPPQHPVLRPRHSTLSCFISTRTQPILEKFETGDTAHFIKCVLYESFSIRYNSCVVCRSNRNLSFVLKTAYSTNYLYLLSSHEFQEISSEIAFIPSVATLSLI
jgi:hypothetical protein